MATHQAARIIIDLDNTLTMPGGATDYSQKVPNPLVVDKIREYHAMGFEIAVHTSRNMRTFEANLGKINAVTLPVILDWLRRHDIPYDEVYVGKPWCGDAGFYVDDKALRPDEFCRLNYDEVAQLLDIKPRR